MSEARVIRFMKYFIYAIVVLSIFAAGFGSAVLYLWNWLMPAIFGLHAITYWQALGLLGLCWILFGGQRGWMGPAIHSRRGMRRRWEHMTPEQREQFRAAMRNRCGSFGDSAAEQKA